MHYEPFDNRFPDIAVRETRTLLVIDMPGLPPGGYTLTEAYCAEPGCDCRRVFFNIVQEETGRVVATIAYGWERPEYYIEWLGMDDPALISSLRGPALNPWSRQSELAPAVLAQMPRLLRDPQFVTRLKQHYQMFKAAVNQEAGLRSKTEEVPTFQSRTLQGTQQVA